MRAPAPLRYVPYRYLLAGRTATSLGNAIAPVALAFAVLDMSGSATALGLVVGTRMVANVVFLLFGGALADRVPRHLLMVSASVAAFVTQAAVAVLVLSGTASVPLLIGLSAVNGVVSAISLPASSALVPQTVPPQLRRQANATNRLLFSGAAIAGAPLGGVLVAASSPGWGIAADALTFLIAAGCYSRLRLPALTPDPARAGILADLRAGWGEFWSRTWLWVIVLAFAVINACLSAGFTILGPVVADETIGRRMWGFVLAAQSAGMLVGAAVAMRARVGRPMLLGVACSGLLAVELLTLGVAPQLGLLLVVTFAAGAGIEQFSIAWETTMQEQIPPSMLARVYSYDMVGSYAAIPLGQVLVGPLSGVLGVRTTLVGAALIVALAVVAMLMSREVRTMRPKLSTGPYTDSATAHAAVEESAA